jgi:hypothetical protein
VADDVGNAAVTQSGQYYVLASSRIVTPPP